jgi:hypothetical protein
MSDTGHNANHTLSITLDASSIKDRRSDHAVKIIAFDAKGGAFEHSVVFDGAGHGRASFSFRGHPGRLRVVVGPGTATTEQMRGLQTIAVDVAPRQWVGKQELTLKPIQISAYYWRWWLWWCRDFKITGRVVCADGNPVPGATVCAYDVDFWWWWWSKESVGCATTDINGAFEIDFTRCCGWWPWWWWESRTWLLEPSLVDSIAAIVREDPKFAQLPIPSPKPNLAVFNKLLSARDALARPSLSRFGQPRAPTPARGPALLPSTGTIDPSTLDALRTRLLQVLPPAPELEQLRLWPWWPWSPWWDCDADIVFQVTQNCGGQDTLIVNETVWQTRWDIPTNLDVTLTANDQACCVFSCADPADCPEGSCLVPGDICLDNVGSIGGNLGAPPVPDNNFIGLLNPGLGVSQNYDADRPYAGSIQLEAIIGDTVDYYELLFYDAGAATPSTPLPTPPSPIPYAPLPVPAFGGFNRKVYDPITNTWPVVAFPVNTYSDGTTDHLVIETTHHYDAAHGAQLWDPASYGILAYLNTLNTLANGTYFVQARGWTRPGYTGNLTDPEILPVCERKDTDNYFVVTVDNQVVTAAPTDPNGLPCGNGIHVCTGQPEAAILQVAILHQGSNVPIVIEPCDNVCIVDTDQLVIDFVAYDPDAFLAYYTMTLFYGDYAPIDLVALAGAAGLSASPIAPAWCPPAAQVGSDYKSALAEGATAPWWTGGAIRLTVPADKAFPMTCAYLLQLYAFKRTISDCDHSFWGQYNLSETTFTIVNPCPTPIATG